jgi:hypothetical protein
MRERPPLVHRSGLPDAVAAGTVRGIATVVPQSGRVIAPRRASDATEDWTGTESQSIPEEAAETQAAPRVVARRRRSGSLTAVDSALEALLHPKLEPRREAPVEEAEPELGDTPAPAQSGPPNGLQHTVVRRRNGAQRPLGLQAPITQDTPDSLDDASTSAETPGRTAQSEPAARAVAAAVGRLHRADVSDVRIERGDEAERLTATAKARAVTRDGEVFIPAAQGSLETGRGGGLLAHELTHVIQQRRLGRSVPLEHSPQGRRLEAEASMTEAHVRGDLGAPAPPPAASQPPAPAPQPQTPSTRDDDDVAVATVRDIEDDLVASGRAFRMPDGSLVFPGSGSHLREQRSSPAQPQVVMQRAPDDPAPADAIGPTPPESTRTFAAPGTTYLPPAQGQNPSPAMPLSPSSPSPAPAPSIALEAAIADLTPASSPAAVAASASDGAPVTHEAPPIDLDDLARRVYGQVRIQLRSELLIDRERAGLLTDFR